MSITYSVNLADIDWHTLKADLAADHFDNGRTPAQLKQSFHNSHSTCIARAGGNVIGTARVLSDGVCNAYLLDVWTYTPFRRQGIARRMVELLIEPLRGQHVYLQSDADTLEFYQRLGFTEQPTGLSIVMGEWLVSQ